MSEQEMQYGHHATIANDRAEDLQHKLDVTTDERDRQRALLERVSDAWDVAAAIFQSSSLDDTGAYFAVCDAVADARKELGRAS